MNNEHRTPKSILRRILPYSLFNIRYSILLLIIISSCSNPYKHLTKTEASGDELQNIYSLPYSENTKIYKADITFYKNDISGLLIIKKIDKNVYRIALTTQFGLNIFDFELNHGILNVKYCIEYLNKKIVLKTFETDFNLLLIQNNFDQLHTIDFSSQNQKIWQFKEGKFSYNYIQNTEANKIENISFKKRNSEKISVGLYNYKGTIPNNINLEHHNIKLKMNFKLIK